MKELKKEFDMSFDELMFKVGDIVTSMNRDVTEFTARGITSTDITAFETQGNDFEAFPPDFYYQADISIEVEAKNIARSECSTLIRKVSGYVQQEWGLKSPQYKKMGIKEFSKKSDRAFITIARTVALCAEDWLSTLSSIGLTQGLIDELKAKAQTMEDRIHGIAEKTEIRDLKTRERLEKANDLYAVMRQYCDVGKLIWEDVNEAKYNDYVIYKTVHHGLSKPQNVALTFTGTVTNEISLTWDPVVDATEYEIYVSQVNLGDPAGEFSRVETVPGSPFLEIIPGGFRFYYKIRAINPEKESDFSIEVFIEGIML